VSGGKDPFRLRLRWRAEWALARVFGRRMLCAACGQPLCVVSLVVWRGKLVPVGLGVREPLVRVRFGERDRLEHLHGELDGIDEFVWRTTNLAGLVRIVRAAGSAQIDATETFELPFRTGGAWRGLRGAVRASV
jgi:hypothetical protein